MNCIGFGHYWDDEFAAKYDLERLPRARTCFAGRTWFRCTRT